MSNLGFMYEFPGSEVPGREISGFCVPQGLLRRDAAPSLV
jgi:hypothetical protein